MPSGAQVATHCALIGKHQKPLDVFREGFIQFIHSRTFDEQVGFWAIFSGPYVIVKKTHIFFTDACGRTTSTFAEMSTKKLFTPYLNCVLFHKSLFLRVKSVCYPEVLNLFIHLNVEE